MNHRGREDRAMTSRRRAVFALLLIPCSACLLAAANPADEAHPDHLIRRANAAFEAGEAARAKGDGDAARQRTDEADRLYAVAEERTADPGLVAFNRATVLFRREQYREAEAYYGRVLQDAACPPGRAARANYNRGTCLLLLGGSSEAYLRAIAYLSRCHDSDAADAQLKANARDNLELAKTLWKRAYDEEKKAGQKPENPNDHPPPDQNAGSQNFGGTEQQPGDNDPGAGDATQTTTQPVTTPDAGQTANAGQTTTQGPTPGASPDVSQFPNAPDTRPRSPEATRKILRDTEARLLRERRILDDSLYTSQLGVKDR
jgi:tetratricopeptide (TPR) repeat protein